MPIDVATQKDPLDILINRKIDLTPAQFADVIGEEKLVLDKFIRSVNSHVITEVFRGLVETTPVLTGRARRNWKPAVNALDLVPVEDFAQVDGVTGAPLTAEENGRLQGTLATLRVSQTDSVVNITNNVPYIGELDRGSSLKAPAGIVSVALARAEGRIRRKFG